MSRLSHFVADSLVLTGRNLAHVRRIPEKLLDVTLQPLMFTLLFAYVFGGVIAIPDGSYREYLVGGVLVQSIGFGITGPATAIASDLREGVVDRFRTLPTARSAYLAGHILAELAAMTLGITVMSLTGLVVGWGIHAGLGHALAGYGLLLLFAFAMLWCGTLLGIVVRSPDAAQGLVFLVVFPMTFLATTFVPIGGFSPVLRAIAAWNPISAMAAAVRGELGNPVGGAGDAWPLAHPVTASIAWCGLLLVVAIPLTVRRFRARTAD